MKNTPAGILPSHADAIKKAVKRLFYSASQVRNDSSVKGNSVKDALNTLSVLPDPSVFSGVVKMTGLPAADPHVVGELWNNAGVLTVSAG